MQKKKEWERILSNSLFLNELWIIILQQLKGTMNSHSNCHFCLFNLGNSKLENGKKIV